LAEALMDTGVVAVTGAVTILQVTLFAPAGTTTEPGMEPMAAAPELMLRVTVVSAATGAPKVTFPVDVRPPIKLAGVKVRLVGTFASTVNDPVLDVPLRLADI
jgi:hypothetical protein